MSWQERLEVAETEDDFDLLKDEIESSFNISMIFDRIKTPAVLRACLIHMKLDKGKRLEIIYKFTPLFRVDLLEVFFEEREDHLTWEDFEGKSREFMKFIASVAEGGYVDVMTFLLDKGMNPNHEISYNRFGYDSCLLSHACICGNVDIVDLLLTRGADVNRKNSAGMTPAFSAAACDDPTILDRLFVAGANLFHCDDRGENLWSLATLMNYGRTNTIRRIISMGIPLERKIYERTLPSYRRALLPPEMKEMLTIMRNILISRGEKVKEIPDGEQ